MIKTIKFDRQTAIKEGLRKSPDIDRGYFKRPILRFLRRKTYPETTDTINRIYNTIPSDFFKIYRYAYRFVLQR